MTNRIRLPLLGRTTSFRRLRGTSILLATSALLSVAQAGVAHAQANTTYTPASNPGSPNLAAGDQFTLTGGNVVFGGNSANDMNFDGTVTGNGGLAKSGTKTLTLNATNSFTGGTTVNAGTVIANANGALPTGGNVTIASGGTLKLGTDQTIGALNGNGRVELNSRNLTVDLASGTSRFDGALVGGLAYVGSWRVGAGPAWSTNPAVLTGQEAAALIFGGIAGEYEISSVSNVLADIDFKAWGSGYGGFNTSAPVAQNYKNDAGAPGYASPQDFSTYVSDHNGNKVNYAFSYRGAGSLTKTGDGTLVLAGNNAFTGTTTVQGGTLALEGGRAISDTAAILVGTAGTLKITTAETIGSLAGGGTVVLDQTLTAGGNNASTSHSGAISGAGGLVKTGAGTLTLTGTNSYTGGTTITAGTLQGNSNAIQGNVVNNGTLAFNQDIDGSFAGTVSGTGGIVKTGAGTLTLTSTNTNTGGTRIADGTLIADVSGALATGGKVTMTGGTLKLGANQNIGTLSGTGAIDLGISTLDVNVAGGTTRFDGAISGVRGVTQYVGSWAVGSGPAWSTNPVVYSGREAAALLFGGNASDYAISTVSNSGADIDFKAWGSGFAGFNTEAPVAQDYKNDAGAPGYGGTQDFSTYVSDWNREKVNYAFLYTPSGALTKSGAGTLILGGANTYTGATTINGGTLAVDGGQAIADTGAVVIGAAGTFRVISAETIGSLSGNGTVVLGQTLAIGGDNSSTGFAGTIGGAGGLTKIGTGTLMLSGTNGYAGVTTVDGGTLAVAGGNAIADSGSVVIGGGGTFQVKTAETIGSLSGSGAVRLDQALTLGGNDSSTTYAGAISGTGALVKTGTGTLTLGGTNNYTGGTVIAAGTIQGDSNAIQGDVTNDGTLVFDQAFDGGYAGTVSGTGMLVKAGSGTLTLSGANTYGGGTLVTSGTLQGDTQSLQGDVTNDGVLAFAQDFDGAYVGSVSGSGALVKTGLGTLTLGGTNVYTGGTIIMAGAIRGDSNAIQGDVANNGTLVFDQGFDGSHAGAISGTGTLVKAGSGTLTLSGANSYSGGTQIASGTLRGDTNSLKGNVANNGVLAFAQDFDGAYAGSVSGTGMLVKAGTGTLTLGGTNVYTGGTIIAAGTIRGDSNAVRGDVANDGTLVFDQAFDGGYAGTVSGSGMLVKAGSGTLTLSGANTYGGGTLVTSGTLQGDTHSLQGDVTNEGVLAFAQDFDGAYAGDLSGTGALVKTGAGAVTLAGSASHSGGTRIDGGVLIGNTSNLQGSIVNHANLVIGQGTDGDFAADLSGTGNLYKAGVGTVRLTGTIDHSGITAVIGGRLIGSTSSILGDISVAQGATLEFDQQADGIYAGSMVNLEGVGVGGQLVKSGAGALTVTGQFGAQGGTRIEGGSLVGTGSTLWGDFFVGAETTLQIGEAEGRVVDFNGAVSGNGQFVKTGAGTVRLSGRSIDFAGTTDITQGGVLLTGALNGAVTIRQGAALQVGDGTRSGDLLADTRNDGTLIFDQVGDYRYEGALSGAGALVKQGSGALTLAGDYAYTGDTVVLGGTVSVASLLPTTTTLQIDGGAFDLGGTSQSVSGLTGTGGSLHFGGGRLAVNQNDNSSYAGNLTGNGTLVKAGTGTLSLLGASTLTGNLLLDAGGLDVGGSLASTVTVANGATLSGTGRVGGMVVRSGGVAAPGSLVALRSATGLRALAVAPSPIGTLSVAGNVTFEAGSFYRVNVNASGASDKIAATGSASIQGGTVQVLAASGSYAPLTHYTLLTADAGVNGKFGSVTSNLAFLTPILSYASTSVSLDLVRNDISFTAIAQSSNERNIAAKVTALGVGNPLFNSVLFMDAGGARQQFNLLSGEIHASTRTAMLNDAALPVNAAVDHLAETSAHSGVWMQGLGNWSQFDANGESAFTRSKVQGLMGGVDFVVAPEQNLRIGIAGGYTQDDLSASAVASTAKLKSVHVLGYLGASVSGVELRAGGGYSRVDADTTRTVPVAGASQRLTASYASDVVQGFAEVAYPMPLGGGVVAPYGKVTVTNFARPDFAETGGSVALAAEKANDTTTLSNIGVRFETALAGAFSVGGKLGWEHAWGDLYPVSSMTLAGTTGSFDVLGAPLSRNTAAVALNGVLRLSETMTASFGYEGRIGSSNQSNAVKGAISLRF
ncbi:autotransporter-associated beta strand repeat-containing protein [Sphingomonas sp. HF-S4]|uniref:Autotransporter-associated beta strand repeat-containing protein n=1 Tax=Sphingomonas agrestis TaxID=3080540 RepID=A0ABU3YDF8_9SPHN|nr:autotransporter-associated beta strand repeat-containing protein [Sphingomonas sp. HF-S4]MDV3459202.1 autotransporter-associated beta strand repeat-containing protein [Sphingomonas sp. HF-S4]